ncbi:E-selectin-like [Neocloeon triangulifer]|uniref:E-selectin-like n=1 Tax=Neocloeon triangulifer TaxID=2078957 RepID=UPI00286EC7CF|nr:E-selectin-like [Neocloeon triangulifer]
MARKLIFGAALTLATFSIISGANGENPRIFTGGYVEIDRHQYYVNATNFITKDAARAVCKSLNLELVSFEERNKWDAINVWAQQYVFDVPWFWIGAERINTTSWQWEVSGKHIKDFYWGPGQPDMEAEDSVPVCLSLLLSFTGSGWYDGVCNRTNNAVFCQ